MIEDDFYLKVARALSGCQLVEQQLKLYITEALELVRRRVGKRLTFKMTGADYEDCPLGRLIDVFNKLNNNKSLVRDLRKFKKERDFLSHRAITRCHDYEGGLFQSAVIELQGRLASIETEAERLYIAIHNEANEFRGELYFGDYPEG